MFFVVSGFCFSALFIQLLSGLPGKWRKIKVDMEFYEYSLVTAGNLRIRMEGWWLPHKVYTSPLSVSRERGFQQK